MCYTRAIVKYDITWGEFREVVMPYGIDRCPDVLIDNLSLILLVYPVEISTSRRDITTLKIKR